MGTEAMKLELIAWLTKLTDAGVVASLYNLKKASEQEDWFNSLTPEQRASVERGLDQARAGQAVSSKEVRKNYGR
jgi:hypothetical protein